MPADFENGVFSRTPAWHGQGIVVDDPYLTTEQVLALVPELASDVVTRPIYYRNQDGGYTEIQDEVANVRTLDDKWLANVSLDYRIVDPRRGFQFMDNIIGQAMRWETAGTLRGGREIFMLAQLDRESLIGGYPDERHSWYLGCTNTYDTRRALTVALSSVRWVCTNTVAMGLASAPRKWSITHTGDLDGKMMEARRALALTNTHIDAFERMAEHLLATPFSRADFKRLVKGLAMFKPNPKKLDSDVMRANKDAIQSAMLDYFTTAPNLVETPANGTAWGAYNAVIEWFDWDKPARRTKTGDTADQARLYRTLHDTSVKDEVLAKLLPSGMVRA